MSQRVLQVLGSETTATDCGNCDCTRYERSETNGEQDTSCSRYGTYHEERGKRVEECLANAIPDGVFDLLMHAVSVYGDGTHTPAEIQAARTWLLGEVDSDLPRTRAATTVSVLAHQALQYQVNELERRFIEFAIKR